MNNEVQNTVNNGQNVQAGQVNNTQSAPTQSNFAETLNKRNQQLQSSQIVNQRGITKTITVNAGTDKEYSLTLQFPGVGIASQIEDDATASGGNIRFTDLMRAAINNDVFVQPHIKSIDFWDTHKGYGEVAGEVLSFLNDGIAGNLE